MYRTVYSRNMEMEVGIHSIQERRLMGMKNNHPFDHLSVSTIGFDEGVRL